MKFFSKRGDANYGRIWNLFADMTEVAPERYAMVTNTLKATHTLQIIDSARRGKIDLTQERFDVWAYQAVCNDRDRKKPMSAIKEFPLHTSDSMPDEDQKGVVVSLNQVKRVEDAFDSMINDTAIQQIITRLFELSRINAHRGYDLVSVLLGALKEIRSSVVLLQKACSEDEEVKDLIETLLTSGDSTFEIREVLSQEMDRREAG